MPSAADIAKLAAAARRSFRERLLDFACEYERLQEHRDLLALETAELKSKLASVTEQSAIEQPVQLKNLKAEIAELREQCDVLASKSYATFTDLTAENAKLKAQLAELTAHSGAAESKSLDLQAQVTALSVANQRLKAAAQAEENRCARAGAAAEEEAQRTAEAPAKAEVDVRVAEEARVVAEPRARADATATERDEVQAAEQEAKERARATAKAREQAKVQAAKALEQATLKAKQETAQGQVAGEVRQVDETAKAELRAKAEIRSTVEVRAQTEGDSQAAKEAEEAAETAVASEAALAGQAAGVYGSNPPAKTTGKEAKPAGDNGLESDRGRESVVPGLARVGRLPPTPWIGSYSHCPTARARLYLLYGAGGRASSFVKWQQVVKNEFPELELAVLEYPGHGNHKGDCATEVSTLVQEFDQQVIQLSNGLVQFFHSPFVIIGQSSGARVGVGLIRKLHMLGVRPEKFYVVGRTPPIVPVTPKTLAMPSTTVPFLNFVADSILTSQKQQVKRAWAELASGEQQRVEDMFRKDFQLNGRPVSPLPRKWRVVHPTGKLIKRSAENPSRMVQIEREVGSEVFVTGEEETGPRGERWVQIDTTRENVKAGWYLTHGRTVQAPGMDRELLEVADDDEPPDERSTFWRAPVPFDVHYSTNDAVAPREDASGGQRPMREWGRLTSAGARLVEHRGLQHDELLLHVDVLRGICGDFVRLCRFR
mmetsp:Transcript_106859/g.297526  ORF Transcript_106859/g.297526 Transcript_106859/m.297526 type:complete len:715 (-) Transcript_106859:143-2287(-)